MNHAARVAAGGVAGNAKKYLLLIRVSFWDRLRYLLGADLGVTFFADARVEGGPYFYKALILPRQKGWGVRGSAVLMKRFR